MKKTLKNLAAAFVGESQARNRYDFYAKIARKEGYEQIAEIFSLTAAQESVHAKRLFEHIQKLKEGQNPVEIAAVVPTVYGNTMDNLKAAVEGENYEHTKMYPDFAAIAQKEGYPEIAKRLRSIAIAEKEHEERFQKHLDSLEKKTIFKKTKAVWWVCRECGYAHLGQEPPQDCPSCDHPRAYYQLKTHNRS